MAKSFEEKSSSATNISDKIIEVPYCKEGDRGLTIRVVKNEWTEIPEHWIKGNNMIRRMRCTGDGCYICKMLADMKYQVSENDNPFARTVYYTPAVSAQRLMGKKKGTGEKVEVVRYNDSCQILKYGVNLYRKLQSIQKHPDYKATGGIVVRDLDITRVKTGGGAQKVKWDATPSPIVKEVLVVEGIEDVRKEIEALENEKVNIGVVNQILGIADNTEAEVTDSVPEDIEVNDVADDKKVKEAPKKSAKKAEEPKAEAADDEELVIDEDN